MLSLTNHRGGLETVEGRDGVTRRTGEAAGGDCQKSDWMREYMVPLRNFK